MKKAPENRINIKFAQELIQALRMIEQKLGRDAEGCVIIKGELDMFLVLSFFTNSHITSQEMTRSSGARYVGYPTCIGSD